jgi:PKD repeat protein
MTDTPEPETAGSRSRATRRRVLQATAGALATGAVSGRGTAQASGPTVYVGSYWTLYAVDAATGTEQWVFETGDDVESSPTVVDGTVYVGSLDDNLYAVDAATGTEQWAFDTGGFVDSSPTVVDGTVYVGSESKLYAMDVAERTKQWAFKTGDLVYSSPTVVDGTVYVGSYDDNLYAVDAATGTEQWAFEAGIRVISSPTVVDGTVYVGSASFDTGTLYAVDAAEGTKQWAFKTGGGVDSSPTVVDGTVYVGSYDGNLYAVDAATGSQQWAFETGYSVDQSPTVVSDPQTGSSIGSRVRLQTLGHHDNPIAWFTVEPTVPKINKTATFTAGRSPSSATSYEWDLTGDGTTDATGETVSFTYQLSGAYDVTLTITNSAGETDTVTRTVTVVEAPPPLVGNTPPKDSDGDGLFERVRGRDNFSILDVQALFKNLDNPDVQNNAERFNFQESSGSDEVTILDVQALFNELQE